MWNLVSYVLQVADIRREGSMPDSGFLEDGLLKTLPGVKPASAAPAPTAAESSGHDTCRAAAGGATALVVR